MPASGSASGTELSLQERMSSRQGVTTQRERIEDALRESGTLLMAFGPLDAALSRDGSSTGFLIFFLIGLIVFLLALRLERSRCRDAE